MFGQNNRFLSTYSIYRSPHGVKICTFSARTVGYIEREGLYVFINYNSILGFRHVTLFILEKRSTEDDILLTRDFSVTAVSNHFHSVKIWLFSSARSRDFDGLIGIELRCQCTQQKHQSICAVLTFDSQLKKS